LNNRTAMLKITAIGSLLFITSCSTSTNDAKPENSAQSPASAPSGQLTMSESPAQSGMDQDKILVSDLFYRDQIASGQSNAEYFEFVLDNSYPGTVNEVVARQCFKDGSTPTPYGVPDLNTLRADPNWTVPQTEITDIDLGVPPTGTTYIVKSESVFGVNQVHVTILDGRPYYFPDFCGL